MRHRLGRQAESAEVNATGMPHNSRPSASTSRTSVANPRPEASGPGRHPAMPAERRHCETDTPAISSCPHLALTGVSTRQTGFDDPRCGARLNSFSTIRPRQ